MQPLPIGQTISSPESPPDLSGTRKPAHWYVASESWVPGIPSVASKSSPAEGTKAAYDSVCAESKTPTPQSLPPTPLTQP